MNALCSFTNSQHILFPGFHTPGKSAMLPQGWISRIVVFSKWRDGLKPYWINTSSNTLIKQLLSRADSTIKQDLRDLIEGGTITKAVDENIVFPEIEADSHHLFSFLLFSVLDKIPEKHPWKGMN